MQGLTTAPKLHLYTASTPNGHKVSILLEELILAYPQLAHSSLSYDFKYLSFDAKHQKLPAFLEINPNARIPALVDDNVMVGGIGHKVFESASVMLWLVENYDSDYKFWFKDPVERSRAMSWIFFTHGGEFDFVTFPLLRHLPLVTSPSGPYRFDQIREGWLITDGTRSRTDARSSSSFCVCSLPDL